MTREQALETLKEMAFTAYGHRSEALDMAISALSDYDIMQKISLDLAFENDELLNELDSIKNGTSLSADGDCISKQKVLATLDFADKALDEERTVEKYKELLTECIKALPSVQPVPCEDAISREFEEIVLEYLDKDICPYPEYKGKPYFSIKYKENGKQFIGFSTYKPEVFSQYLKDYFMPSVQPKKEDNTMDIYSDLLRVKHGTMSIDSLIDKVWCGRKMVSE